MALQTVAFLPKADAQTLTTIYSFCSKSQCADGAKPFSGLLQAADGELWGTTWEGGGNGGRTGTGTVFKITTSGALTTVHSFCARSGCSDGANPVAGLMLATNGDIYGTTTFGGSYKNPGSNQSGGTVFQITPGALTTLDNFCLSSGCPAGVNPDTGSRPSSALVQAPDGNLYGTTVDGGADSSANGGYGGGTVYRITPDGVFTSLYSFCAEADCADGSQPSGLVLDADGNLYGSTAVGGLYQAGTVFRISTEGVLTTLYSFCAHTGCPDGMYPNGLVQANDGNLYGTTNSGGEAYGTVFRISTSGKLTTLHSFQNVEGGGPSSALIQATDGNLYGTTSMDGAIGGGSAFRMTLGGTLTTLYSFCGGRGCDVSDGGYPSALVQATDGNLYRARSAFGVTSFNNSVGEGTVFKISLGLAPFITPVPAYGAVGSTITVLGTNVAGATAVTFNGTAAKFTVVSKSSLKATVPAGAASVTLLVKLPGSTLASSTLFRVVQ